MPFVVFMVTVRTSGKPACEHARPRQPDGDEGIVGYYYFGARSYEPTLRRWLAPDPIMLGMLDGAAINGESLNLYSYGANNPVRFTDKSGHVPLDTIWDAGNVVWDVGKIVVGYVAGDIPMAISGGKDLIVDGGAMLIPYVPAGLNKVDDVAKVLSKSDEAVDAAKAGGNAADAAKGGEKAADAGKAAGGGKKIPNPDGSRGGQAHQQKIQERIDQLKKEGHEHVAGGRGKKEEVMMTPGGHKESRRPDITTRKPDGSVHRENVGKARQDGEPVARDRRARDDIEKETGKRPEFSKYN